MLGYYLADEELFQKISRETGAEDHRHPLTFMLEAADDIAYRTADIEDAFVKGFLPFSALERELRQVDTGRIFRRMPVLRICTRVPWNEAKRSRKHMR